MSLSDFLLSFFGLFSEILNLLFGTDGVVGLLNSGGTFLTYIFCFGGFALFGFSILYFVFGFIRGD